MKRKYSIFLSILITCSSAFGTFEIRDATYEPTPNFIESDYLFEGKKQKIYVANIVLISFVDVEDAFPVISGTSTFEGKTKYTYGISITLTDSGSEKMKKITKERVGKPLAFMLEGKVHSVPVVSQELSKRVMISGFSKKLAEELSDKIMYHNQSVFTTP